MANDDDEEKKRIEIEIELEKLRVHPAIMPAEGSEDVIAYLPCDGPPVEVDYGSEPADYEPGDGSD